MLIHHDGLKELDAVHELIDWSRLKKQLSGSHFKKQGEKAWRPLMMIKALLLQSWYKLSDPALEKQLARDFLFRRFTGLDFAKSASDGKRKSTYGYKAHMKVDEDGYIKSIDYTAGMPQGTFSWYSTPLHLVVHDSNCFTGLLSGAESAVYAPIVPIRARLIISG